MFRRSTSLSKDESAYRASLVRRFNSGGESWDSTITATYEYNYGVAVMRKSSGFWLHWLLDDRKYISKLYAPCPSRPFIARLSCVLPVRWWGRVVYRGTSSVSQVSTHKTIANIALWDLPCVPGYVLHIKFRVLLSLAVRAQARRTRPYSYLWPGQEDLWFYCSVLPNNCLRK